MSSLIPVSSGFVAEGQTAVYCYSGIELFVNLEIDSPQSRQIADFSSRTWHLDAPKSVQMPSSSPSEVQIVGELRYLNATSRQESTAIDEVRRQCHDHPDNRRIQHDDENLLDRSCVDRHCDYGLQSDKDIARGSHNLVTDWKASLDIIEREDLEFKARSSSCKEPYICIENRMWSPRGEDYLWSQTADISRDDDYRMTACSNDSTCVGETGVDQDRCTLLSPVCPESELVGSPGGEQAANPILETSSPGSPEVECFDEAEVSAAVTLAEMSIVAHRKESTQGCLEAVVDWDQSATISGRAVHELRITGAPNKKDKLVELTEKTHPTSVLNVDARVDVTTAADALKPRFGDMELSLRRNEDEFIEEDCFEDWTNWDQSAAIFGPQAQHDFGVAGSSISKMELSNLAESKRLMREKLRYLELDCGEMELSLRSDDVGEEPGEESIYEVYVEDLLECIMDRDQTATSSGHVVHNLGIRGASNKRLKLAEVTEKPHATSVLNIDVSTSANALKLGSGEMKLPLRSDDDIKELVEGKSLEDLSEDSTYWDQSTPSSPHAVHNLGGGCASNKRLMLAESTEKTHAISILKVDVSNTASALKPGSGEMELSSLRRDDDKQTPRKARPKARSKGAKIAVINVMSDCEDESDCDVLKRSPRKRRYKSIEQLYRETKRLDRTQSSDIECDYVGFNKEFPAETSKQG